MQQFMVSAMDDLAHDRYEPGDYPPFAVTVDIAVFTIRNDVLHLALVRRGEEPFRGQWALPGGFVRTDEDLDQAAVRELREETALRRGDSWHVEQLGSYGAPGRDPRMRVVTVAYVAVCPDAPRPRRGGDAAQATFRPIADVGALAFDHGRIVGDALERVGSKLEYTALAAKFLKPVFTVTELRQVYETVWGFRLNEGNFQRGFRGNTCFRPAADARGGRGRPASQWSVVGAGRGRQLALLDRPLARRNAGQGRA